MLMSELLAPLGRRGLKRDATGPSKRFLTSSMSITSVSGRSMLAALKIFVFVSCLASTSADYWKDRAAFLENEEAQMLGSSIVLNRKEEMVNEVLMRYKVREYDAGFKQPGIFAPGKHFFHSRRDVEESKVFKFLQKLPKGAALHGHDTSLVSEDFLHGLTFKDDLYACTVDGRLRLRFMMNHTQDQSCNWSLISALRKADPNYDPWVKAQLTLDVTNPKKAYPTIDVVWRTFMEIFKTVYPLLTYRPVFQEHFYEALRELHEDNVLYLEFRGTLPPVYELNGTTYNPVETLGFYKEVIEQFKTDYPDFLGARFIYGPSRRVDNATATSYVETVKDLKREYPSALAGFDLVGQEDEGKPLASYVEQLQEIASNNISFFFHAGETNWYGTTTDVNLVDAVLLGTKRIGHGYALTKHPLVMKMVKEKGIAVEVCPISNQVLMLVDDMRNHPAAFLIAAGYPVVISYDDPSFWSTKGLSYDFYMAFMGIASRDADLKLLKQLAKNSLLYSAMPEGEKQVALRAWEEQWDKFVDSIVEEHYSNNSFENLVNSIRVISK